MKTLHTEQVLTTEKEGYYSRRVSNTRTGKSVEIIKIEQLLTPEKVLSFYL